MGSLLESNLLNCGMLEQSNEALKQLGFDPDKIYAQEHDAGLGNGGLGRLAACFLDSLASLKYPGHGFGIRYRYGLFEQRIIHGNQIELPDYWLKDQYRLGNAKRGRSHLHSFSRKRTYVSAE